MEPLPHLFLHIFLQERLSSDVRGKKKTEYEVTAYVSAHAHHSHSPGLYKSDGIQYFNKWLLYKAYSQV